MPGDHGRAERVAQPGAPVPPAQLVDVGQGPASSPSTVAPVCTTAACARPGSTSSSGRNRTSRRVPGPLARSGPGDRPSRRASAATARARSLRGPESAAGAGAAAEPIHRIAPRHRRTRSGQRQADDQRRRTARRRVSASGRPTARVHPVPGASRQPGHRSRCRPSPASSSRTSARRCTCTATFIVFFSGSPTAYTRFSAPPLTVSFSGPEVDRLVLAVRHDRGLVGAHRDDQAEGLRRWRCRRTSTLPLTVTSAGGTLAVCATVRIRLVVGHRGEVVLVRRHHRVGLARTGQVHHDVGAAIGRFTFTVLLDLVRRCR